MNPIFFKFNNFEIRWYSILILIGVVLAYQLANYEATKYKAPRGFIFNLTFWIVIFGILGARLYYVAFNWSLYSHDIMSIFKFWEGGLAIHGGLLAGIIVIFVYCQKYKVNTLKLLDIAAPSMFLAQAIGRWGNFFNSEAHGPATTLAVLKSHKIIPQFVIDGMNINGTYYEPAFYYESLWCLIGMIILLIVRYKKNLKVGTLTGLYLMWYSLGRFFIESMRVDSLMIGGFKVAQIISLVLFTIGLIIIIKNLPKGQGDNLYRETSLEDIRF